ncbi:class I SAM-dependent methyltransferase [Streptomyces spongiae]|uniref:class I SAM-dependent methyltransferase n=1 Tax=Streptomyces spongiae TaxID=565072 RepID=UPI001883431B|nr:class I SAM-dependent methyltransferase [Streptomyces spongiae]
MSEPETFSAHSPNDRERYGDAVFTQDLDDEPARLAALSSTYDHISKSQILRLDPQAAWRCLDAGSGPGVLAAWLATHVPDGEVVAADRDVRLLEQLSARHDNLRSMKVDLTDRDSLSALGTFDLVHARFVLMHQRTWPEMMSGLASLVAPGGWLVLSDFVDLSTDLIEPTPYRRVMSAMWDVLRSTIGTDISWVPTTPSLLRKEGLCDVRTEVFLPSADHRSSAARFWRLTWGQLHDRLLTHSDLDSSVLADALASFSDPDFTELSPGMMTTMGRRPSG